MGSEWGMQYTGTLSISTLSKLRKERSQTGRWFFGVISKSSMAFWIRSHQDQSTRMSTLYHLWKLHSSKLCRRQVSVGRAISKITLNQSTGAIELKDCHERNHRSNLKDYLKCLGAYSTAAIVASKRKSKKRNTKCWSSKSGQAKTRCSLSNTISIRIKTIPLLKQIKMQQSSARLETTSWLPALRLEWSTWRRKRFIKNTTSTSTSLRKCLTATLIGEINSTSPQEVNSW